MIQSVHFYRKDWGTLIEQSANINSYSDSFYTILFTMEQS